MYRKPRIGLALGAGGVLGGAWLAGGLTAIARTTGWNPSAADILVGTSAGSVFAGLVAGHVPPARLLPASEGAMDELGELDVKGEQEWVLAELSMENAYRVGRRLPNVFPGSVRLIRSGMRRGTPLRALAGLAPAGVVSTEPIENTIRRAVPFGWGDHPNCWIVACDYETGERVVFGRPGSPQGHLADAVAASCAIPGFFKPVRIAGRLYVDGGLHSMSNLDVLCGQGLDLVIVMNPLSSRHELGGWNPLSRMAAAIRKMATRQVDEEVERLLAEGTNVVVIEPTVGDLAVIGHNVMDARRSQKVGEVALRTTTLQLEQPEVRELLESLPRQVRRPRRAGRLNGLLKRAGFPAAAAV